MKKEEKAFLVVLSVALGTIVFLVVTVGDYFAVTTALLFGLAIAFLYPILVLLLVNLSMVLKRWAYQKKLDSIADSGQQTIRAYLFILLPVIVPVLMIFYLSFGIINRLFKA
jgi:hypothetical protein